MQEQPHRMVDLFCGCGGFALGASAAGFGSELAFDVDTTLTSSFKKNFPNAELIIGDLSQASGDAIKARAGGEVLGVFGGPPCQGFSDIGHRKVNDPRRQLLGHFFRLVSEISPTFFVMENVKGLGYADARPELDRAIATLEGRYEIVGPVVLDAADYGAATKRRRIFVIGYDAHKCSPLSLQDLQNAQMPAATVEDAISDLLHAEEVESSDDFDWWRLTRPPIANTYRDALIADDRLFTGHRVTTHTKLVETRFSAIAEGGIDTVGRHPRLAWKGQCPTLRAGTGAERGSFQAVRPIHPERPRVITVREAARLQGFPDAFRFHPTVWHSFRMIGNSVSPIMSKAIFDLIAARVEMPKIALAPEWTNTLKTAYFNNLADFGPKKAPVRRKFFEILPQITPAHPASSASASPPDRSTPSPSRDNRRSRPASGLAEP